MIYVRWQKGYKRRGREFTQHSPDIDKLECPHCGYSIGSDRGPYTLVAVGPVDDDEQERYEAGKWFNAGAVTIHSACLARLDNPALEQLVSELIVSEEK